MAGDPASERERAAYFGRVDEEFSGLLARLRRRIEVPDEIDDRFRRQVRIACDDYVREYRQTLSTYLEDAAEVVAAVAIAEAALYLVRAGVEEVAYRASYESFPKRFVAETMDRVLPSGHTLSERIWDLRYEKDIIKIVDSGIGSNLSPETIAKQLDGFIRADRQVLTRTPYGRTLSFDSMRLARTEVGRSYRAATVDTAKAAPWVTGIQWNLSLEHPSILCDCVNYDGQVFPPDDVPMDPHPQCLCTLSHVTMSPEEWKSELTAFDEGQFVRNLAEAFDL